MKRNRNKLLKKKVVTTQDYLKAIRRADREIDLERHPGWVAVHKVFKNKKVYDRKAAKTGGWQNE